MCTRRKVFLYSRDGRNDQIYREKEKKKKTSFCQADVDSRCPFRVRRKNRSRGSNVVNGGLLFTRMCTTELNKSRVGTV